MKTRRIIILFSILAFAATVVLLNSFVFSVREVRAYCFNSVDETLKERVVEKSGIELYKNIIVLNEKKAVKNIENEMPGEVKVINIERKFPDKVWIHFVKLVPVIAVETGEFETGEKKYAACEFYNHNLSVIDAGVPASALLFDAAADGVDKEIDGARPVVRAAIKGSVVNPQVAKPLELSEPDALLALCGIVDTINSLGYREHDFVRLLKEIDISGYGDAVNPVAFLKMRDNTVNGITIEIQNAKLFLLEKVQHAISAYEQYLAGTLTFSTVNWTVYNNSKNEIIIAG